MTSTDEVFVRDRQPTWTSLIARTWVPVVLAAPALAFPLTRPWLSASCLLAAVVWFVLAGLRESSPSDRHDERSPLRWPMIALCSLAVVGSWFSQDPPATLPKLAGLVLGFMVFRALVITGTNVQRVQLLGIAYLVLGLATVLVGLLSGPTWKYWGNYQLYELALAIPRPFRLPSAESGVNPNALGATTLFFLPVLTALTFGWPSRQQGSTGALPMPISMEPLKRGLPLLSALALFYVLVLTQSRSSFVSAVVAMLLVLSVRFQIVAVLSAVGAQVVGIAVWWFGAAGLQSRLQNLMGNSGVDDRLFLTLSDDRWLIWTTALRIISEHPLTGIGLGAFRRVYHPILIEGASDQSLVPHAHNVFLQVALDLGLPGLIAYVALLAAVGLMVWHVFHHGDVRLKTLCVGLSGAVVAVHLFGLTDAIALGAKVGLFFWFNLGLIAASYNVVCRAPGARPVSDEGRAAT